MVPSAEPDTCDRGGNARVQDSQEPIHIRGSKLLTGAQVLPPHSSKLALITISRVVQRIVPFVTTVDLLVVPKTWVGVVSM